MTHDPADLIAKRRRTHGDFSDTARIAGRLKDVLGEEIAEIEDGLPGNSGADKRLAKLGWEQREALDLILTKIARIVAGDPDHADHWRDIAGYALLAITFDAEADARGSYDDAVRAVGAAVRGGAALPEDSPFVAGAAVPQSRGAKERLQSAAPAAVHPDMNDLQPEC